ncbi:MAG: DUF11 domain-containing protein [Chloroflexi bacterium]|nr:MAG: DUF11 domain-containing protein [Chloroflexota bacterium]
MQKQRGPGLFRRRLALLSVTGLLILAGLSLALVASAQDPPLTVTKSALPGAVEPGEVVAYTLTFTNTGPEDLALIGITDTLPAGFSFAGMQAGPEPSSSGGPIVWTNLEDVGSGSSFQLVYAVQVDIDTVPAVYPNVVEAQIEGGETVTASAEVTVLGAILDGIKTASASEVMVGEPLDYAVVITNSGTSTATLTTISDTLPSQFEYLSMLVGPAPTEQDNSLIWSHLEVGPGQSLELGYRVRADGPVDSIQTNRVEVSSPDESLAAMETDVTLREHTFWVYIPLVSYVLPPPPVTTYRLAFERQTPGNFEVYAVDADGTDLVNISDMGSGDVTPQFSPDGNKIAWVHFLDGSGEIMVANANGSNQLNVTNHAKDDRGPTWSPDGTKIAFYSLRQEERWEVYSMNADGSNVERLTDRFCQSHDPVWSPDGTKIAFICGLRPYAEVYVMNADGSNWQRLTEDATNDYYEDAALNWSPDSTRLAYVKYYNEGHSKGNIFTVDVNTKEIVQVTNKDTASHSPAWSPDGTRIAFSTYDQESYDIVIVDPDGSNLLNLTRAAKFDNQPRWSSDGAKIAFISNRASSDTTVFYLYVMDADGSDQVRVTNATANELNPTWRPQP